MSLRELPQSITEGENYVRWAFEIQRADSVHVPELFHKRCVCPQREVKLRN